MDIPPQDFESDDLAPARGIVVAVLAMLFLVLISLLAAWVLA